MPEWLEFRPVAFAVGVLVTLLLLWCPWEKPPGPDDWRDVSPEARQRSMEGRG